MKPDGPTESILCARSVTQRVLSPVPDPACGLERCVDLLRSDLLGAQVVVQEREAAETTDATKRKMK